MRRLDLDGLPPGSAGATVARSSGVLPEYLLAAHAGGVIAARWHRNHAALQQPHSMDDHMLSYCVAGRCEGRVLLEGAERCFPQRSGALTFLPAGRPVQWFLAGGADFDHWHLYISAEVLPAVVTAPVRLRDSWLDSYFRLLAAEVEGSGPGCVEKSTFLDDTADLLLHRLELLLSDCSEAAPTARGVSALRPHLLGRVRTYIDEHPHGDVRLGTLAGLVAMSPRHFLRAFRRATGTTPHRYVLDRRLDYACDLLRGSDTPVSDIARRCGFCSAAHFATLFHRYRGCTPSEFRRLH
jgi:AraC family transcriptional regulator